MINAIGLFTNILLDPLLIFGVGPFPKLGVVGAALATIFAQFIVTIVFIIVMKRHDEIYFRINIFQKPNLQNMRAIIKLGLPVAIQSGIFSFIGMVLGRIIAAYGSTAIAVQKVGSQIESLSWMTAGGFSTALSAFIGQNFGAKKYDRIIKGYKAAFYAVSLIGIFATLTMEYIGLFLPLSCLYFSQSQFSKYLYQKKRLCLWELFICRY